MTPATDEPPAPLANDASLPGLCWDCNYSLQGLDASRCPECGRPFDLADPASFNQGKPMGRLARGLLRPAPWHESVVYAYVGLSLVAAALIPVNRWVAEQVFFAGWILLSVPYSFRSIMRSVVIRRYAQPRAFAGVDQAMLRRVARVTLWTALLLFMQVPLYLSFLISMPAGLNALGRDRYERMPFVTVNQVPLTRHQYGLFRVKRVDVHPRGADLYLWHGGYDAPRLHYAPGGGSSYGILMGSQLTPSWSTD